MTGRSVLAVLFVVMVVAVSAIELSTWLLGRAVAAIVPAASITEVNAEIPRSVEPPPTSPHAVVTPTR